MRILLGIGQLEQAGIRSRGPIVLETLVEKTQRKQVCQARVVRSGWTRVVLQPSPAKWDDLESTIIASLDIRMSS